MRQAEIRKKTLQYAWAFETGASRCQKCKIARGVDTRRGIAGKRGKGEERRSRDSTTRGVNRYESSALR